MSTSYEQKKSVHCQYLHHRELKKRSMKRMEMNDAEAFLSLAADYRCGNMGFPKNINKALELYNQAAELGSICAHHDLSNLYHEGEGVVKDMEKALHHARLAAMKGHEVARHNLGAAEQEKGKKGRSMDQGIYHFKRAMKHYMIAARAGYDNSLKVVGNGYKNGLITKEEYAHTLRAYQVSVDGMKSQQRTEAAAQGLGYTKYKRYVSK